MSPGSGSQRVRTAEAGYAFVLDGHVRQRFDEPIEQVLDVAELDLILVRTQLVGRQRTPQNLWAFHQDGRPRWRAPRAGILGGRERYEEVAVWSASRLVARMQNVGIVVLDVETGTIVAIPSWWSVVRLGLS